MTCLMTEAHRAVAAAKATQVKVSTMARNVSVTRGMLRHPYPPAEHHLIPARGSTNVLMTASMNVGTAGLIAITTTDAENATILGRGAIETIIETSGGEIRESRWNTNDRHWVRPPLLTSDLWVGTFHGEPRRQWYWMMNLRQRYLSPS